MAIFVFQMKLIHSSYSPLNFGGRIRDQIDFDLILGCCASIRSKAAVGVASSHQKHKAPKEKLRSHGQSFLLVLTR